MNLLEKTKILTSLLHNHSYYSSQTHPLFIACSGGLDSRFLAYFAKHIGIKNIELLHIMGPHIDPSETAYLKEWATKHNFSLHLISLPILEHNAIQNNHPLRCYYCKYLAFSAMYIYIKKHFCYKMEKEILLHDGTHFDDTKSHRPGLVALSELNIQSPLVQAHFTKQDILQVAKNINLDNFEQKAKPCLLTRFAYNTPMSIEKLHFVARAEKIVENIFLKEFGQKNTPIFRIREVRTNIYEIHTLEILPTLLIDTLQTTLKKVSINNKFPVKTVEHKSVDTLSGYFDRLHKN